MYLVTKAIKIYSSIFLLLLKELKKKIMSTFSSEKSKILFILSSSLQVSVLTTIVFCVWSSLKYFFDVDYFSSFLKNF